VVGGLRRGVGVCQRVRLNKGVEVEVLRGRSGRGGGEGQCRRPICWLEPTSDLELIEDETEDHGIRHESAGFHSRFGFDAYARIVSMQPLSPR
jgi:hypothetical protein